MDGYIRASGTALVSLRDCSGPQQTRLFLSYTAARKFLTMTSAFGKLDLETSQHHRFESSRSLSSEIHAFLSCKTKCAMEYLFKLRDGNSYRTPLVCLKGS